MLKLVVSFKTHDRTNHDQVNFATVTRQLVPMTVQPNESIHFHFDPHSILFTYKRQLFKSVLIDTKESEQ